MKTIGDYANRIDTLPIHSLAKIEICQKYVYSKIKWDLSIYDFSETWVKENIDSNLNRLCGKWCKHQCKLHTSSNAAEQTRYKHHTRKKHFTINQFVKYLKRHQILKPRNFTKLQ